VNRVWTSTVILVLAVLLAAGPAYAYPLELEQRLTDATRVLRDMLEAPDGGIPADLLKRSSAVVIFPSVLKAGLGVGGHYGKGVIVRRNTSSRTWGPPVFLRMFGGSFGWQIGVQTTDLILLVMSEVNLKSMFQDRFTIGADASVAAGPVGRDASAATDVDLSAGILSYSRAKGLFAGVSVKGSVLDVDWEANESYYGSDVSVIDTFFKGKGEVSPAATKLIHLLNRYSTGSTR